MGRGETIYNPSMDREAKYYRSIGCNNAMIARQFGVSQACIVRWKTAHPSFKKALHSGMVANLETGHSKKDAESMLRANGMWKGSE